MARFDILLLGDGSQPFRTMGWVLEYRGFSLKAVGDPEAALEAMVKKNYDLIIAKVSKNEKDSFTALRLARKINPLTKIMLIADRLAVALPLEAYEINVDDYLIMPISAGEFWRRVENCLSGPVIDLAPADSISPTVSKEKFPRKPLAYEPRVAAAGREISAAF